MKIRAILETETMDPDFRESFLNGMPFDITESTFDRIVRYASGCTDVQQPDVIAMVIQHSLDNRKELSELLDRCNHTTQISVILNGDTELSNEEENKLYDEDETLTDKVLRLLFGDTFFTFIAEYNLDGYDSWEDTVEDLVEDLWMTYWELHEA